MHSLLYEYIRRAVPLTSYQSLINFKFLKEWEIQNYGNQEAWAWVPLILAYGRRCERACSVAYYFVIPFLSSHKWPILYLNATLTVFPSPCRSLSSLCSYTASKAVAKKVMGKVLYMDTAWGNDGQRAFWMLFLGLSPLISWRSLQNPASQARRTETEIIEVTKNEISQYARDFYNNTGASTSEWRYRTQSRTSSLQFLSFLQVTFIASRLSLS